MKKSLSFLTIIIFLILVVSCEDLLRPGNPKNVHASVSGNTMTLTWTAVKGAEQYHIFRKMEGYFGSSGQFLELIENPTTNAYTENLGSTTGTTYTYQVCAEKNNMFSDKVTSNSVTH